MRATKDCLHIGKVVWSEVSFNNSGMSREVHVPLCEGLAGRFRRSTRLFSNSEQGAACSALYFSFRATCKYHKVNFYLWLKYVFRVIKETPQEDFKNLLPYNILPELLEAESKIPELKKPEDFTENIDSS